MKIKELLNENAQSLNQLDDPEYFSSALHSWENYYGDEERAKEELFTYTHDVNHLIKFGGNVYRVIYANSPEEVNTNIDNIGHSWTTDQGNINDYSDENWGHYGQGKKHMYVIVATVGPNNITNRGVDIHGNPHEKEIGILRMNEATYELYSYRFKSMGKKIRENIKESTQSLNQLDDPKVYQECLDSWRDYYEYEDRALSEIEDYKYVVDRLIQKGGKVYRVIFANSPEEIRMDDLGVHWTIDESNIDAYLDSLWTNYGKGKKNSYVVVAEVGPNNITNRGVDVAGNPEEKEVNIIRPNEATYQAFEYTNKGRRQRVRENINKTTTLSQLYSNDYPDHDEVFWNYVSDSDLDKKLEIETLSYSKLNILLLSQYRAEHLEEIVDMMNEDSVEVVKQYQSSPNLASSIVVVADNRIIDGNHRAMAAALNHSSIKYVDLDQLDQNLDENMDHSKDDQAVPQLKAALLAQKKKIQSVKDDKDAVYDIIDGMMTSIAKAHSISGQKLHDMWAKKYKEIPDTWVMHQ